MFNFFHSIAAWFHINIYSGLAEGVNGVEIESSYHIIVYIVSIITPLLLLLYLWSLIEILHTNVKLREYDKRVINVINIRSIENVTSKDRLSKMVIPERVKKKDLNTLREYT